jgi:hypothetical protein
MLTIKEIMESTYNIKVLNLNKLCVGASSDTYYIETESAGLLGKIHNIMAKYTKLPEGMGDKFFSSMTPQRVIESYRNTMSLAIYYGDKQTIEELKIRLDIMNEFPYQTIDMKELSCGNTHGDYFVSQFIAKDGKIAGVIDWTTACVHPYVWEIFRSFVYREPSCMGGNISIDKQFGGRNE